MALTKIKADGLTADLIDETKLADNSIDSEHYNDGSIDNAHLADNAVGVAELSATGTASSSTFLRGDNSWVTPTDTNTQLAFANDANNRVVTGDGSGGLNGEANLTFDGNDLTLQSQYFYIKSPDGGNRYFFGETGNSQSAQLSLYDSSNAQKVRIAAGDGASQAETFFNGGNVKIGDGDLVIGTAGHGIDFSANSHASGMQSELLDSYEEGTWDPDFFYHSSVSGVTGHYTKIGRMVYAYFCGTYYSQSSSQQYISNLPFTIFNVSGSAGGVARGYQNYDIQNGPIYWLEQNTTKMHFYKDNGVNFTAADGNGHNFRGMIVYTAA